MSDEQTSTDEAGPGQEQPLWAIAQAAWEEGKEMQKEEDGESFAQLTYAYVVVRLPEGFDAALSADPETEGAVLDLGDGNELRFAWSEDTEQAFVPGPWFREVPDDAAGIWDACLWQEADRQREAALTPAMRYLRNETTNPQVDPGGETLFDRYYMAALGAHEPDGRFPVQVADWCSSLALRALEERNRLLGVSGWAVNPWEQQGRDEGDVRDESGGDLLQGEVDGVDAVDAVDAEGGA